ncbi:uncharacterized protein LOC112637796 [Camponotus floridanus]|uniref:uncharacterized protein LOC112637796 n=1 Tax=Camponotus floridanus TaxID=104421 RepID=UPI000DC670D1|nr:uncharacterized protein LOC112637796 [Camponotus floridanus]
MENDIAVCLISEMPVQRSITTQWALSSDGLSGIYHRPEISGYLMIPRTSLPGIVAVDFGELTIISCYLSPNWDRAETLEYFDNLSDIVDSLNKPAIIAGDLNAKSPMWGSLNTNSRGRLLEDWISERDLCILNQGSSPTCVRPQGSSVIDVTLCTAGMVRLVHNWKVLTHKETLSDHYYIYYEINTCTTNVNSVNMTRKGNVNSVNMTSNGNVNSVNMTRNSPKMTRKKTRISVNKIHSGYIKTWSWKKINEEDFRAAIIWRIPEIMSELSKGAIDLNAASEKIKQILADAADFTAKKKSNNYIKRSSYWWNSEIEDTRRNTLSARRAWTRYNRKRNKDDFDERTLLNLRENFKTLKAELRNKITQAKINAWNELLLIIDEDPWGLPFKIVMSKAEEIFPSLNRTG